MPIPTGPENLQVRTTAPADRDIAEGNSPATPEMRRGYHSMVWLLIVLLAVTVMLLAMWGRFHSNQTSTVNPTNTKPVGNLH